MQVVERSHRLDQPERASRISYNLVKADLFMQARLWLLRD